MKSSTKKRLSHARAALLTATLLVLLWNLTSLGALANGREAFVRAFEGSLVPAAVRLALGLGLLISAAVLEIAFVRAGLLPLRTRGIARLQTGAAIAILLVAVGSIAAFPLVDGDLRVLHEVMRRKLGTPSGAALPLAGLGALALFAFQAVEASVSGRRAKLFLLAGFVMALTIFVLGLRALVPLVSGAPILSS
jgi:hypothetical protein